MLHTLLFGRGGVEAQKNVGFLSKNHMMKNTSKSDQDCVQGFSILSQIV